MRIVFIGTVGFSKHCLDVLLDIGADIVGVVTMEEGFGRKRHSDWANLTYLAEGSNIPIRYTSDINARNIIEWIGDKQPGHIFCIGWSQLIKQELLSICPVVGYHPAALPNNRGRHPLVWPLVLGLHESASTFFYMDSGADTGDIISQMPFEIEDDDKASDLYSKIKACASVQLKELFIKDRKHIFDSTPQDKSAGNTWRKRTDKDSTIDWRMSVDAIYNLVRALDMYGGAIFLKGGKEYRVFECYGLTTDADNIEPGKIMGNFPNDANIPAEDFSKIDFEGPIIKCGDGAILLSKHDCPEPFEVGEYL